MCSCELSIRSYRQTDKKALIAFVDNNQHIWSLNQILEHVTQKLHYVLFLDDVVAGLSCFSLVAGELELQLLQVDHAHRRRGFASLLLLQALHDIAQRHTFETCFLEVRASNYAAVQLYQKLGFKKIAQRQNYYPALDTAKREHAWIFQAQQCELMQHAQNRNSLCKKAMS